MPIKWQALSNLQRWMYMDAQSRALFDLTKVHIYINPSVRQAFDWSESDWKLLSGAPSGSTVSVDCVGGVVSMLIANDEMLVNPFMLPLTFDEARRPHRIFPQKLEVSSRHQVKGVATRMVALCANTATALGFRQIELQAIQSAESTTAMRHNGAYTFARLGFDGAISDEVVRKLPSELKGCRRLLDLVETPSGVKFWREHADSTAMSFDLSPGSRNWAALRRYLNEKRIRVIK
ncbi:hypothetical protein LMG29542_01764 [Paraburkholderia humisilvae]|uniref:Uncharacterized protein n=2 Tax=Paraburkholderia humisilvae TaxID=627669 RepID=A0A6J5DE64_9BURK|nr:hypothetical protein LMG29542_01764 [Paraburkholderia humisilvae]